MKEIKQGTDQHSDDKFATEKQNFLRSFTKTYGIDLFNIDCLADTSINVPKRRFDFSPKMSLDFITPDLTLPEFTSDEEKWLSEFSELFSALNSLIKEIGVTNYAEAMDGNRLNDKKIAVSGGLFGKIREVMDKFKGLEFSDVKSELDRFMTSFRDVISKMDIKPDNGFVASGNHDKLNAISDGRLGNNKNGNSADYRHQGVGEHSVRRGRHGGLDDDSGQIIRGSSFVK